MITNRHNPVFIEYPEVFTDVCSRRRNPCQQATALSSILKPYTQKVSHVLELGCGVGHLCAALQSTGFRVTGIDRSYRMIELARQYHSQPVGLNWILADFMVDELCIRADVVLLLYSLVQTFDDTESQVACLLRSGGLLKHHGLILIECTNDPVIDELYPVGTRFHEMSGGWKTTTWSRNLDDQYRELHIAVAHSEEEKAKPIEFVHRLLRTDQKQLEDLLIRSGARVLGWRNAPDFSFEFDPSSSPGMLAVAEFSHRPECCK